MSYDEVVVLEKPLQHLGLGDWNSRVSQLRNVAETKNDTAFQMRHDARTLRNETRIEADWTNYQTNIALSERKAEIERWRITIQQMLRRIENEMQLLREEKATTERELQAMTIPLAVISECLSARDGRLGSELTYDEADIELKKELSIVENNMKQLRDQCQGTWDKLNRLEDVHFKLSLEITNKIEAEEVDIAQIDLNKFAACITFKPDPIRNPKNCVTYEAWLDHTKNIKQMADNELADTYAIRESLFVCREKAKNILKAQSDKTEQTLRKRIFEIQRARNELAWQKFKQAEEIERVKCEIKTLEQALLDKTNSLKLAETRLENRAQRSGIELCLDEAHEKLVDEVIRLRNIRRLLNEKIDCAKTNLNSLAVHLIKLEEDLNNKQHALMTDIRSLDLRCQLKKGPTDTQTDRNIKLVKMEDEIPNSHKEILSSHNLL
ncbi:tektin-B1 [Condylostylus longicornis]|uniref:tektin-B1 n=1 Tax=Condylostylus longicornis TaxID=2530218 RepID=UPI00244E3025|nr:tektin-B1 [Condylostylus longicornis]